jgi:hypothetical protein
MWASANSVASNGCLYLGWTHRLPSTMQASANSVALNGCLYLRWTRRLTLHHVGLCKFCGIEWLSVPGPDSQTDPPPYRPLKIMWPRMGGCTWAGLTDLPSTMQASANSVVSNDCLYLGWVHRVNLHNAGLCKFCGLEWLSVPGLDSHIDPPPCRPLHTANFVASHCCL